MKKGNSILQDFWEQPVSNGFKVGGLLLGVAYLWIFFQLAPLIRDQAVMFNDIQNIKSDVSEIKADINGLYDKLITDKVTPEPVAIQTPEKVIEKTLETNTVTIKEVPQNQDNRQSNSPITQGLVKEIKSLLP